MELLMTLFVAGLFVVLTPGLLVTLPKKGSKLITAAIVHGLIFGVVYHLTHKAVMNYFYEGFAPKPTRPPVRPKPAARPAPRPKPAPRPAPRAAR
jgi:hypothetical protein